MIGIRRIAVLTSGGDAPGMNAAVRSVVRSAICKRLEVLGVRHGFSGLIERSTFELNSSSVAGIINRGGTVLGTTRSQDFTTREGREKALTTLRRDEIDAVVIIGGSGSQQGAFELSKLGVKVVSIPATINNDVEGTDISIGFDTALNIALEAIDRLRTTASSLDRAFLVEVMGRKSGFLAVMAAIAGGAEVVVIPEAPVEPHKIAAKLHDAYQRIKRHAIAIVAEGASEGAEAIAKYIAENHEQVGFEVRTITLGHIQRGGAPLAFDRLLASRLGIAAVEAIDAGRFGVMVGWQKFTAAETPLAEVVAHSKQLDLQLLEMADVLAI